MTGRGHRDDDAGRVRIGRGVRLARLVAAGTLVGVVLAGCGGKSTGEVALALQNDIRAQLPEKVQRVSDLRVRVRGVRCTHRSGNGYDCVATISRPDGKTLGGTAEDVAIDATCDGDGCVWRTVP